MVTPVLETQLADLPVRRGKVRDIYDLGDQLLLVSTDRISAFDGDKNSPPPALPDEIVQQTRAKYIEAFEIVTGQEFAWK